MSEIGKWIADFPYSPRSFVDTSILIELTESEKSNGIKDRQFLINLSEKTRNNYEDFLNRALNRNDYVFDDE
nr:hypothetical protein [uncultured Carboxylicivirga sp.]